MTENTQTEAGAVNNSSAQEGASAASATEQQEAPKGLRAAFDSAQSELAGKTDKTTSNSSDAKPPVSGDASANKPAQHQSQTDKTQSKDGDLSAAPAHWSAERKAIFDRLDPEAKAAWVKHDKDWDRGITEKMQRVKPATDVFEVVSSAITPELRAEMKSNNISEVQVVDALIKMGREVETNPVAFIQKTMRRHGIDPRMFVQNALPVANGQQQNAQLQQLMPILQPLLSKVEQLENGQRNWQQKEYDSVRQSTDETIDSFSKEVDANGALKFPYLDRVMDTMVDLIENTPRYSSMEAHQMLEHAYHAAVALSPEVRDEWLAAEVSKKHQVMQQSSQSDRLNRAATVKPVTSTAGSRPEKRGLRGAYDDAKAHLRQ